jgi:hypothetical protein
VARSFALFLAVLLLLQTFSRELVVLDYQVHKERITELFCVNKDKPALQCNGKCHLAKQLRKSSSSESKAPAAGFAKIKYEVVVPFSFRLVVPLTNWLQPLRFAVVATVPYTSAHVYGVFHPPAFQA